MGQSESKVGAVDRGRGAIYYRVLHHLAATPGLTVSARAQAVGYPAAAVRNALARLTRAGYVTRYRGTHTLSVAGRRAVDADEALVLGGVNARRAHSAAARDDARQDAILGVLAALDPGRLGMQRGQIATAVLRDAGIKATGGAMLKSLSALVDAGKIRRVAANLYVLEDT